MQKFDSPEEELAYQKKIQAKQSYAQAMRNLVVRRKDLPAEEYRSEEDNAAWKILRSKASFWAKEVQRAQEEYLLAKSSRREKNTLERIKELLEDVKLPTEQEKLKIKLNPEHKSVEEVSWMKAIADAARKREAAKSNPEDILEDGLELPPWEDPEILKPHSDNTAVVPIEAETEPKAES